MNPAILATVLLATSSEASSILDERFQRLENASAASSHASVDVLAEILVTLSRDPCVLDDEFAERECRASLPRYRARARRFLKEAVFEVPLRVDGARYIFKGSKLRLFLVHERLNSEFEMMLGRMGRNQHLFTHQPKHGFCGVDRDLENPTPFHVLDIVMNAAAARDASIRRAPEDAKGIALVKVSRVAQTGGGEGCDQTYAVVSLRGLRITDADGATVLETGPYR